MRGRANAAGGGIKKLASFSLKNYTINNITLRFTYEDGMTWREWCESAYNVGYVRSDGTERKLMCSSSQVGLTPSTYPGLGYEAGGLANPGDLIRSGEIYKLNM